MLWDCDCQHGALSDGWIRTQLRILGKRPMITNFFLIIDFIIFLLMLPEIQRIILGLVFLATIALAG